MMSAKPFIPKFQPKFIILFILAHDELHHESTLAPKATLRTARKGHNGRGDTTPFGRGMDHWIRRSRS